MMLRKLEKKDVLGMLEWMHDPEIYRFFRFACENNNEEDASRFILQAQNDFEVNKHRHYAIVDEHDEYLGTISLKDIDMNSLNAEYAISLRKGAQGKGIATIATKEILRIAFEDIGLNRVYLNVLSENAAAIRLYEKCGFVYEGEFREHISIRGNMHSLKWYGILRDEYIEKEESYYEDNAK